VCVRFIRGVQCSNRVSSSTLGTRLFAIASNLKFLINSMDP